MVKPDKFDGSTSWVNFKSHFEICAELNGWMLTEKGMYLAVALQGQDRVFLEICRQRTNVTIGY
jgi:hypothetical protein